MASGVNVQSSNCKSNPVMVLGRLNAYALAIRSNQEARCYLRPWLRPAQSNIMIVKCKSLGAAQQKLETRMKWG